MALCPYYAQCKEAPGCGEWKPRPIPNPDYKGKWTAPLIDNPEYKVGRNISQALVMFSHVGTPAARAVVACRLHVNECYFLSVIACRTAALCLGSFSTEVVRARGPQLPLCRSLLRLDGGSSVTVLLFFLAFSCSQIGHGGAHGTMLYVVRAPSMPLPGACSVSPAPCRAAG